MKHALAVDPAEIKTVRGEMLKLSPQIPRSWSAGTRLRELQTIKPGHGTAAKGSLVPSSVVVRAGDKILTEERDYRLEREWGALGIGPQPSVTTDDVVIVDYAYSLLRLDSRVRTPDGREIIKRGTSHLTAPQPPALAPGETRLSNLFVPYHSDGQNAENFSVLETAGQAKTLSTPGRIARTMAKLRAGQPVKIVCWGDSVTEGGDASSPATRYPAVFEQRLKQQFPNAQIEVQTIAIGGSHSGQWLDSAQFPFPTPEQQRLGRFERILEARPDLVTIEFVNDAGLNVVQTQARYTEILQRLEPLGAEVILITPHFTMPEMMGFQTLRESENRPYVLALREFATRNSLGLADASARWEHLWREGIPYITLLQNAINHPDDRGHALFADELMKCFAP
ncbi:MAG: hypothetical protein JWN98_1833 [Abditibacteriota bacterium]|nr:hypothetical protein [Abditibacteriota bacterium]